MQMPTVAEARTVDRTAAQRKRANRREQTQPVRIIDLRRLTHRDTEPSEEHPGREYRHRWVVRGHWREQAYGPERALRRPTWIPSYLKGPTHAPFLPSEHVFVWRR